MVTENWRSINSMNTGRSLPGLHVVDNILTVFGGRVKSIEYLNATGNWEMSPDSFGDYIARASVAVKCPA